MDGYIAKETLENAAQKVIDDAVEGYNDPANEESVGEFLAKIDTANELLAACGVRQLDYPIDRD